MSFRTSAAVLVAAVVAVLLLFASPVGASTTETLPEVPDGVNSIIGPAPGDGVAPQDPGDRGGWAQLTLFGVIVGALVLIGLLLRRDIRRSRARRAAATPDPD